MTTYTKYQALHAALEDARKLQVELDEAACSDIERAYRTLYMAIAMLLSTGFKTPDDVEAMLYGVHDRVVAELMREDRCFRAALERASEFVSMPKL